MALRADGGTKSAAPCGPGCSPDGGAAGGTAGGWWDDGAASAAPAARQSVPGAAAIALSCVLTGDSAYSFSSAGVFRRSTAPWLASSASLIWMAML